MNRFVNSALALAATGSLAFAGTSDSDWLGLDNEINSLASSYTQADGSMSWAALLRITYSYSTDDVATDGGDDISGFSFEDVDVALWGGIGDYGWMISTDVQDKLGGDIELENGHVWWNCGEYFTAFFGSYRAKVFRSNAVLPDMQLFINRSVIGSSFDFYHVAVGAHGAWEGFGWNLDVLNGDDDQESGHSWVLRVEYAFGAGATSSEGARGGTDQFSGVVGICYWKDDTYFDDTSDADITGVDFHGTYSQFGFGVEFAQIAEDYFIATSDDFSRIDQGLGVIFLGDSDDDVTPWDVYVSFLLNEQWEFGVRLEDADDENDSQLITVGANYYVCDGVTWQANWADFSTDSSSSSILGSSGDDEGSIWQVGLVVGHSASR